MHLEPTVRKARTTVDKDTLRRKRRTKRDKALPNHLVLLLLSHEKSVDNYQLIYLVQGPISNPSPGPEDLIRGGTFP
jgi:hypothetical protein